MTHRSNSPNSFLIAIYEWSILPEKNESPKKLLKRNTKSERVECSVNQAVLDRFIYLLEMEDLQQINWSCIEITKTKKRFIVTVRNFGTLRASGHPWINRWVNLSIRRALISTVKGTQLFPLNNVGDIVGLDGHEGNIFMSHWVWVIPLFRRIIGIKYNGSHFIWFIWWNCFSNWFEIFSKASFQWFPKPL